VREFKYLGYVFQKNGGREAQIKDRVRKGAAIMGQVWGIGKRRFSGDWSRRLWLFDALVWSVVGYGVEIWGWREWDSVERLQNGYIRWLLGVDWRTPGYMVREEVQRDLLRGRAGQRAWRFEERLERGEGSEIARLCLKEIRDREGSGEGLSEWEIDRIRYYEERGVRLVELRKRREAGGWRAQVLIEKKGRMQRAERWRRIEKSKYNKWYGRIKKDGVPEYLRKGWGESRCQRVARFRLGNEMREGKYWEGENKRRCRMCGLGHEDWRHVWEDCGIWGAEGNWEEMIEVVLGEEGEGERWLRRLEEYRGGEVNGGGGNGWMEEAM